MLRRLRLSDRQLLHFAACAALVAMHADTPSQSGSRDTKKAAPDAAAQTGWRAWWELTRSAISAWIDDYAPSMGAALSYYTVFSLAPLLFIVISLAGLAFGQEAARGEIFGQLQGLMGTEAAAGVQQMLASFDKPSSGISGTLIGAVVLIIGATTVFGELQDALDRIWRVPVKPGGSSIWHLLRTRLLSFGMVLAVAFLLVISLVFSAALSALGKWYGVWFANWEILGRVVDIVVGFALTTSAFALIYKLMPRARVGWADVWVGALVTSVLFTLGRLLIGLYIGRAGVASGFGAAGGVIIVFVWVYYSAQIFLVGAEFTWAYAQKFGSRSPGAAFEVTAPKPEAAADAGTAGVNDRPERDGLQANVGENFEAHLPAVVVQPAPAWPVFVAFAAGMASIVLYRRRQRASRRNTIRGARIRRSR